jgi:hypothetical protein
MMGEEEEKKVGILKLSAAEEAAERELVESGVALIRAHLRNSAYLSTDGTVLFVSAVKKVEAREEVRLAEERYRAAGGDVSALYENLRASDLQKDVEK